VKPIQRFGGTRNGEGRNSVLTHRLSGCSAALHASDAFAVVRMPVWTAGTRQLLATPYEKAAFGAYRRHVVDYTLREGAGHDPGSIQFEIISITSAGRQAVSSA